MPVVTSCLWTSLPPGVPESAPPAALFCNLVLASQVTVGAASHVAVSGSQETQLFSESQHQTQLFSESQAETPDAPGSQPETATKTVNPTQVTVCDAPGSQPETATKTVNPTQVTVGDASDVSAGDGSASGSVMIDLTVDTVVVVPATRKST